MTTLFKEQNSSFCCHWLLVLSVTVVFDGCPCTPKANRLHAWQCSCISFLRTSTTIINHLFTRRLPCCSINGLCALAGLLSHFTIHEWSSDEWYWFFFTDSRATFRLASMAFFQKQRILRCSTMHDWARHCFLCQHETWRSLATSSFSCSSATIRSPLKLSL